MESIRHSSLRPTRAACRRRNRRAGTNRRPRPRARARLQRVGVRAPGAARAVSPRASASGAKRQRRIEEPAEPDALALALFADAVHAVVPVAGAHQRQAVRPTARLASSARAQCSNSVPFRRPSAGRSCHARPGAQRCPSRNGIGFVQHGRVAGRATYCATVGEPGPIVGDPRAHALAGMRQPPVLHVALDELPPRRAQQVLARQIGLRGGSAMPSCNWSRKP
jgi:hypothetical protein